MRPDGTLVLYDWELFRRGVPAVDLAITVVGLGDRARYAALAACYVDEWRTVGRSLPWSAGDLTRDIALAKAASVVHLLAAYTEGRMRPREGLIPWLVEAVPPWMQQLA